MNKREEVGQCLICDGPVLRIKTGTGWIRGGTGQKDRMGYRTSYHCDDCGIVYGKPPVSATDLEAKKRARQLAYETVLDENKKAQVLEIAKEIDRKLVEDILKSIDTRKCSCMCGCSATDCDKI